MDEEMSDRSRRSVITYSVILYLGLMGSIIWLVYLWRNWVKGDRGCFFLLTLAVTNILAMGVFMGIQIAWNVSMVWLAGDAVCKMATGLNVFAVAIMQYVLAAFCWDNAIGILTQSSGTVRRKILIILAFIFVAGCSSPLLYVYGVKEHPYLGYEQCMTVRWINSQSGYITFHILLGIFFYLLPMCLIIVANIVALVLWKRKTSPPLSENADAAKIITERRNWTLELFAAIMFGLVFFLTKTPGYVYMLVLNFINNYSMSIDAVFAVDVTSMLGHCLYPCVYGVYRVLQRRRQQGIHGLEPKPKK